MVLSTPAVNELPSGATPSHPRCQSPTVYVPTVAPPGCAASADSMTNRPPGYSDMLISLTFVLFCAVHTVEATDGLVTHRNAIILMNPRPVPEAGPTMPLV